MRKETRLGLWALYMGACFIMAWQCLHWLQAPAAPVLKDDLNNTINTALPYSKWRLVSYWSDWCNACEEELANLNQIHKIWPDLEILSVHIDLPPVAVLQKFVAQYQLNFRLLQQDPKAFFKLPDFSSIPANFVIAPDGTVHGPFIGKIEPTVLAELFKS